VIRGPAHIVTFIERYVGALQRPSFMKSPLEKLGDREGVHRHQSGVNRSLVHGNNDLLQGRRAAVNKPDGIE